jgi:LCP family protein required for cell wall assembly
MQVRRTVRTVALTVSVSVAWVLVALAGAPERVPSAQAAPVFTVGRGPGASHFPALDGSRPIVVLALGSDARPGETVSRARADSIHLITINPAKRRATVLGFPRDSWVNIPGHGSDKINAAMVYGGPELVAATVQQLTGIPIDYYLLTSFPGLVRMVDSVGGFSVDVPYPMNDRYSGANFNAGPQHFSGREALQFSRNRKDTPKGDFSRSENQGRLIVAALAGFRKAFQKDPASMLTWIGAGLRNSATDVPLDELVTLAFTVSRIPATNVKNLVVPGGSGFVGSKSVVFIGGGAGSIYANLRDDGLIN